ncbi:sugar phosphate nucleotidyltransferase [Clostridium cellulovorans]|uniref:Nucleotidyl transferase n=1 Tax=Clostridium cellulovorans (strain ATCC 35296 / DSM 3052 / OCM 3 / 743B) TaxID=573061 RepID=D9SQ55_CLOC7|nr:sugar phosphate nucleotidyltransferase [Clostridium cellulovorans]ADL50122.1 Nucleotidyl transferase [Clostridium cellulovorans 743B]
MKAIVMAGGEGTRLRPLTCNIPKPMMPILGKPVMEYAIENLRKIGITQIGVTLQYLPDEVINYFGDGKEFGVNIQYFIEETPLGTAGSVKNAESFLDETFVVISGDALTDIHLEKAIKYHKEKEAMATMILKEVSVPLEYGVVVTDKDGKVNGFLEKPSWSELFSDKANTGIYILEPEIFSFYEQNQKFDFSNDLFPIMLKENKPLMGYVADGYWCDIGSIEQYMKCSYDILSGLVDVDINAVEVEDGVWVGKDCTISPKATITPPVYIGNKCRIYEGSKIGPFSIIGKNNIISSNCNIKRSIMFDNCYIGTRVELKGTVLCNKVQMESRAAAFEESSIGDETLVCSKATIKPGVKIWPEKVVESGSIIKSNLIWGGKHTKSIFGKQGVVGEVNVDITPEFVAKLGSAYGSNLSHGAKVAISCNDYGASQMFKYALATGLLSMGIEIFDLKRVTTSMARHTAHLFGADGAIHVMQDREDAQKVTIQFMDENGVNISSSMERKIEGTLLREDFRRVKADELRRIDHYEDCIEYYIRHIINSLDDKLVMEKKYNLVISVREKYVAKAVFKICETLKIGIKEYDTPKDIKGLAREVVNSGANMGIYFSDDGEEAVIIDEKGTIIRNSIYEALKAYILLKRSNLKVYATPVSSSMALEKIAEMCESKLVRTKTSQKDVFNGFLSGISEGGVSKEEILRWYLMSLDSICMFALTLNHLAKYNTTVSALISLIPRYNSKKAETLCPWNKKGKVMRSLIEQHEIASIDLIEGIKLNYKNTWALVLPDKEEPLCRIYAESESKEKVDEIIADLTRKIENIVYN